MKTLLLAATHAGALLVGIALGIYLLPILTEPAGPASEELAAVSEAASFEGTFVRDRADSDFLHWGEGSVSISADAVAFEGAMAPGPDYKLYFSPEFVETEADFLRLKSAMVRVGDVKTFDGFVVPVPPDIDPAAYRAVIVWCESFGQFITAASYRQAD